MNDQEFENKMNTMLSNIKNLPHDQQNKIRQLVEETRQRHYAIHKAVKDIEDTIGSLRTNITYLIFDLEATRRENQQLRNLLDSQDQDDN